MAAGWRHYSATSRLSRLSSGVDAEACAVLSGADMHACGRGPSPELCGVVALAVLRLPGLEFAATAN